MRLIDADALKDDLRESYNALKKIYEGLEYNDDRAICGGQISTFLEAILRVKEAPTVDAVEVVRCGECKYRSSDYDIMGDYLCEKRCSRFFCKDNDFCSYGERRNDT